LTTLNLAREQLRLIEERITSGIGAPLERAEAQTQIATAETNLLAANQYVTLTENGLKRLLFPNTNVADWSASITPSDQPSLDAVSVVLADALSEARSNRPELNLLRFQREINKIDEGFYLNQAMPRVDLLATFSVTGYAGHVVNPSGVLSNGAILSSITPLFAGSSTVPLPSPVTLNQITIVPGIGTNPGAVTLPGTSIIGTPGVGTLPGIPGTSPTNSSTGTGGTPPVTGALSGPTLTVPGSLVGGAGQQLRNLFSFSNRTVAVGVTIELPLKNRAAHANLAAVRTQEQQLAALMDATEQSIEADVRNAVQMVETSRQQIVSARSARESAEVQLAGERKLYQTGLSTTFLVFQRENQLSVARDTELRAETDYSKALANLQHATSTTLHANNVLVESPVGP
jgi:outer membrane protein TolC